MCRTSRCTIYVWNRGVNKEYYATQGGSCIPDLVKTGQTPLYKTQTPNLKKNAKTYESYAIYILLADLLSRSPRVLRRDNIVSAATKQVHHVVTQRSSSKTAGHIAERWTGARNARSIHVALTFAADGSSRPMTRVATADCSLSVSLDTTRRNRRHNIH